MRRLIIFLTSLTLALALGASPAWADAIGFRGPQPATLKARAVAEVGTPGSLVPVEGTLRDAQRRPMTGVPVVVSVPGDASHGTLESLTGSGGAFELYVPLPDQAPASGTVELTISFHGTEQAAASSLILPVRVAVPQEETTAGQPGVEPEAGPVARPEAAAVPSSGSALIDQLIVVAAGLFGLMVALFAVGAFLRRRR